MQITHDLGTSIALKRPQDEEPLWRYTYSGKPKPFFHPLRTPAGFTLTLFEPYDHIWHRGLWFTIKFINGENFWEERDGEEFGTQVTPVPPTLTPGADGSVEIAQQLEWTRPNGAGLVFREERRIVHRPLNDESYALDWDVSLTAQANLLLDRTVFTTWGGYGGLTVRGNRNWQKTRLLFADGSTSDRPTPVLSDWCDLSGSFDGGKNATGGIAMFDHPDNIRHPSPWYGSTGLGHYFNAAFLFNEPLNVASGETLRFRYRVLVHDGVWDADRLNAAYQTYVSEANDG
jgi:hypothetical protein